MDFLQARPEGLFRAKGFVQFPGGTFMLHTVGSYVSFTPVEPTPTQLVLIGAGIDPDSLTDWLMACVADGPVTEQDMLWVLRYAR
jgi:hypothetical protein